MGIELDDIQYFSTRRLKMDSNTFGWESLENIQVGETSFKGTNQVCSLLKHDICDQMIEAIIIFLPVRFQIEYRKSILRDYYYNIMQFYSNKISNNLSNESVWKAIFNEIRKGFSPWNM